MKLEDLLPKQPITLENQFPDYLINDPQVVGYPDVEMQTEIYNWVNNKLGTGKTNLSKISIKDFGAGRGDFSEYSIAKYYGYEILPNLVEVGKFKYKNSENFNLYCKDFMLDPLVVSDFTICIGTLNSMQTSNPWQLFEDTLQRAMETTTDKIIFVLNDNNEYGFNSFPISQLQRHLPMGNLPMEINMDKFEDIYMLTLHVGGFKL
jgi:hypothetical protein